MCSLISINTQGLRSDDRKQLVFNFFSRNRVDIILLQETHWTEDMHHIIQQDWKGKILYSDSSASARGVAILFHEKLDFDIKHSSHDNAGRTLTTMITMENTDLNLINIYAPNTDTERCLFYSDLEKFLAPENNVLAGDFNSIEFPRLDKIGGSGRARQTNITILADISARHNLHDIWRKRHPNQRDFTWTGRNTMGNSIIRTRIDKFFISNSLSPFISKATIEPYPYSDHDLITISFDLTQHERGPGFWHFNNTLLSDPIFADEITTFWNNWLTEKQTHNILDWWDKAKTNFKQIAIQQSSKLRKLKRNERRLIEKKVKKLQRLAATGTPTDTENYFNTNELLRQFETKDLEATKIRAKAKFTEQGECSTRYFFNLEKRQQECHTIKTLTRDNLDTVTDTRDLISETYNFYHNLFSAEDTIPDAQQKIFTHTLSLPFWNMIDYPATLN